MTPACQACAAPVALLLGAGRHPVANRFLRSPEQPEPTFDLSLGQCEACALVQLTTIVPPAELLPRFDWITYNEPEGHLEAVVATLLELPGVTPQSAVGALTYKDESTLRRLGERGYERAWRVDAVNDLGLTGAAGLESIQARLPDATAHLRTRYGQADLLLVRHILEHAHDTQRFAAAVRELMRPGGYAVFEVPDCSQVFDTLDYTTVWEEHVLYFTARTYASTLESIGFEIVRVDSYPYPYENSLVAVVRNTRQPAPQLGDLTEERARARRFADGFEERRALVQAVLCERVAQGQRVALFGAGHLSCMFINLYGVAQYISFVVDDHPGKKGLFMPGSKIPIRESAALLSERVDLCLSSLSPESEEKVVARQTEFIARGGEFASIFPSSRRALRPPTAPREMDQCQAPTR